MTLLDTSTADLFEQPAPPPAPVVTTKRPARPARPRRAPKAAAPAEVHDHTTDYARRVLAGDIVAGPHVRAACARHLRDLVEGPARGLKWDAQAAEDRISFYREVCCLNGGQFEGIPFELDFWQQFIVGSLQGWKVALTGARRFRFAYIETGKGSGKSPMVAGIGIAGLVADGENRAEVYAAATKKDQAQILFRDAVAMYDHSLMLQAVMTKRGVGESAHNLAYLPRGSFFRPVSMEDGVSGPRPHVGLVDEFHEHKTDQVVLMLKAGIKFRREPLIIVITNSGSSKNSPCGIYHDMACRIAAGTSIDDEFFAYVCGLDEGDDWLNDPTCWPKSNPSLQFRDLPGMKYLQGMVTNARNMPSLRGKTGRLNFCVWEESTAQWLTAEVWRPCRADYTAEQLRGRRAWVGLDLSSTTDLTGMVILVEPVEAGEPWRMLAHAWLPSDGLIERAEKDRQPYLQWQAEGYLETTPGAAISRPHLAQRVAQILAPFDVQGIAFDRWRMADFKQSCADLGLELPPLIDFGQGFKDMSPAIEAFETAVLNRQVVHDGHPILTMCAANAITVQDPAGNRKLDKAGATGRIDLIVAAVMAYGCLPKAQPTTPLDDFLNSPVIA